MKNKMIFTDRTITVRKGESRIDEPIVVYRGDYELEVRFTILNSRFKFMSGTNMIESEKASYGQLAILTPYGGNIFSDIVRCNDGSVTFVLTAEMLNQIEEVGLYSFQIRLMDYNKESRVSIPPIEFGIEVREPIASEDHDNSVNNAIVGYSIAKVVDPKKENIGDTFDENGNYNKTKWETGDRISEGKLNKIEDAINKVNKNEMDNTTSLSKRIDNNFNVLDATKADKVELDLQAKRIDSFTALEDGSTTGDAELTDGRIGWDGRVYNNLGNAIREQLKTSMKQYIALPFNLTENCYIDYRNGDVTYHERSFYNASDFIKILPQSRMIFIDNLVYDALDKGGIAFYNSEYEYISGHQYDHIMGSLKVSAPDNAIYMRFTYKNNTSNNIGSVIVYQDVAEILSNIDEITKNIMGERIDISVETLGEYVRYDGEIGYSDNWFMSNTISMNKGETLYVYTMGHDRNVAVISQKNGDTYTPLSISIDRNFRWYAYNSEKDNTDIIISSFNPRIEDVRVFKQPNSLIDGLTGKCEYVFKNNIAYKEGSYIAYETGDVRTDGNISHLASSDYIHVNPNSNVIINNLNYNTPNLAGLAFYDENKNFVEGIQYQKMTDYSMSVVVPAKCKFMRISAFVNNLDTIDILNDSLYYLRNDINNIKNDKKYNYCKMFHKIAGIGDSLMSGEIVIWNDENQAYDYIDCYNYSWLSNLCRDIGSEAIHYSRGGRTTKTWLDEYLDVMKSETEKPSAYFIALGTNDSNRDVVLGEESDCGTLNDTFYGNYSRIIDEIKGFNPDAVIFCLSLYFVASDRSVLFSDAIKRIAELRDCYYVDFLNSHLEYSSNDEIISKYVYRGHFTTLGYIRVGEEILELVNSVIDENAVDLRFFSKYFMDLS